MAEMATLVNLMASFVNLCETFRIFRRVATPSLILHAQTDSSSHANRTSFIMQKMVIATLLLACDVEAQSSADSALNVLDATNFFVCGSSLAALNGHYVLSDERQSDEQTPVFVREDDDQSVDQDKHDFRLYRHNGFWLIADVAEWPPKTHFRCDPTKRHWSSDVDVTESCGMNLLTPPRIGYSPVDAKHALDDVSLHQVDCGLLLTTTPTPRVEL